MRNLCLCVFWFVFYWLPSNFPLTGDISFHCLSQIWWNSIELTWNISNKSHIRTNFFYCVLIGERDRANRFAAIHSFSLSLSMCVCVCFPKICLYKIALAYVFSYQATFVKWMTTERNLSNSFAFLGKPFYRDRQFLLCLWGWDIKKNGMNLWWNGAQTHS